MKYLILSLALLAGSSHAIATNYAKQNSLNAVAYSSLKDLTSSEKATVYTYAKEKVKKYMKYPSTCKFPKLYNTDAVRFFKDDKSGCYGLGITFKAENSYGMQCNQKAIIIFKMKGDKPSFVSVEVE